MHCVVSVPRRRYIDRDGARNCVHCIRTAVRDKIELYTMRVHTKKGAKGSALGDLVQTCLSFSNLFFFILNRPGKPISREIIFLAYESVPSGSPRGSAKYDDTHGAATRQYSTSGGGTVDVDLRASLRE